MNKYEIEQMNRFEKEYWWHVGKKNLISKLVRQYFKNFPIEIFEIGCGTGEISFELANFGTVYANDVSKDSIEFCKNKGLKNLILKDINELNAKSYNEKFDLVVALDVLEHVQDDVNAIRTAHKLLKKGGIFLINVPAYKFLWSFHDEALHHKRRYTSYEITKKLTDNGFKIKKKSHFVFFAFPVIAIFKFLSNYLSKSVYPTTSYIELPKFLNTLMIKILYLETMLLKRIYLPLGTTITVVAEKS